MINTAAIKARFDALGRGGSRRGDCGIACDRDCAQHDCGLADLRAGVAQLGGRVRRLRRIRLYPIELGFDRPPSQRGRPVLADPAAGERILARLQRLSARYGTDIRIEDGVGIVRCDESIPQEPKVTERTGAL